MPLIKLPADFKADNKSHVTDLQKVLAALKLVPKLEPSAAAAMEPLNEAIKVFKKNNELGLTESLTPATIETLNVAVHDNFIATNKTRVANIHNMLEKINIPVDKTEKNKKTIGVSTRNAIISFQKENNLPQDGKISEELFLKLDGAFIDKKLSAKVQVSNLQTDLLTIRRIGKMEQRIDEAELKAKVIGASTTAFIIVFQTKYKIEPTGKLDRKTLDKIQSVVTSRGIAKKELKKDNADSLKIIKKQLRLNMADKNVANAQHVLLHLGFSIDEKENKDLKFGKTTRKAVLAFQKMKKIPLSGHLDAKTLPLLNKEIIQLNPDAATSSKYRIRGSVRDELWIRKNNMVLKVYEQTVQGKSATALMTKKNMLNGFFDITYEPPIDKSNGQVKQSFNLLVELWSGIDSNPANDVFIESQILNKVNKTQWVNFTLGDDKYKGDAAFTVLTAAIKKNIGLVKLEDITDTPQNRQVLQLSNQTGLSTDEIMRLLLANKIATNANKPNLTPEVFYAFLSQNLPAGLPGDLYLPVSIDWNTINVLIENAESGIGFLDSATHTNIIETAIEENLVSRQVNANKEKVLQELTSLQVQFALQKQILVGNGNIDTLIINSSFDTANSNVIAQTFIINKGFTNDFWKAINANEALNTDQVKDFKITVDLGGITKNFIPVLQKFKADTGQGKKFETIGAIAKLTETDLENYISTVIIPEGFATHKDYAITLKQRSEAMFPAIALVAGLKRSNNNPIEGIENAELFFDTHTDFDIHADTVDVFVAKKGVVLDAGTKTNVKTIVRVRKLTDDAATAVSLLENKFHSSSQIYFTGRDRLALLVNTLDENAASRIYEKARLQYTQVLGKLMHLNPAVNLGTPAAISKQTYTKEEIAAWLGDIPNLESLFGNLDFCECEHCKSLYSPSAYLVDLLRYLKQHTAVNPVKNVKDILFERRPDIGNILLNCVNTDTPIPYIDLVCEILENTIPPLATNANFNFQTLLTKAELRAMPQNVRQEAYDLLSTADFPMRSSFNLNQAETRSYLNFLGIPRYEVMENFRDISNLNNKIPDSISIAAEYFNFSIHEKAIVLTPKPNKVDQEIYWGFDQCKDIIWQTGVVNTEVSVRNFMNRSQLDYKEVLALLMVEFVNPAANKSEIVRPIDTCSTDEQKINNLTVIKLDLMHRFIRLWRKTGWKMWELDLVLQNNNFWDAAGNTPKLDNLKLFKQLQEKLSLSTEILLAFYSDINIKQRINPENSSIKIANIYEHLFQNPTITKPIDARFTLPLNNALILGWNDPENYSPVPTILSALSVQQKDLDQLLPKTDGHLTLQSLSVLLRYGWLAKAMRLPVDDLLLLEKTNGINPFISPEDTLKFIKSLEYVRRSTISISELDYVLNFNPASSIGWRGNVYDQLLATLKNTLKLSQELIEQLQLTGIEQTAILAFDTDALTAMADNELVVAIAPLVDILTSKKDSLSAAKFAEEQRATIISFGSFPVTAQRKTKLTDSIKFVKASLQNILDVAVLQVQAFISGTYSLQDKQVSVLFKLIFPPAAPKTIEQVLTDKAILQPAPDFSSQLSVLSLLHKLSLLIQRMNIDEKNLQWFINNFNSIHTVDFSKLPVQPLAGTNQYVQWLNLNKFYQFKIKYPEPELASLRSILDKVIAAASIDDIIAEIIKVTQWDIATTSNLKNLAVKLKLNAASFLEADTFEKLQKCFEMLKISGVDANTLFGWNDVTLSGTAIQTRLSIKSKYENEDWLAKITPLQDDLREQKRTALVAYFLEFSQRNEEPLVAGVPNAMYWTNANMLFKHFLIDVEMSACQLTSRIKQVISSVQFFVQRCYLNLENRFVIVTQSDKEDASSANAWSQWKWMKNYRIWEANRKVFFYPENWIEPELRDDKSKFFEELENEILQNEITNDNVETAFVNYLHKLDEVANLDVCGLYHELEDENLSVAGFERNITHVIGRTKAIPHIYYYRQYDNILSTWTAWDKIDLDITGDHLVPVVYNRKLHIFWLVTQQKPMKVHKIPSAQPTAGTSKTQDTQDPAKFWEIQLAWSVNKHDGWTPKKVSKEKIIHPWERPLFSYHLKPYYFQKLNQLYLDIYLTTSSEFNDELYYDQLTGIKHKLTNNPYNESFLAWHSSAFIFDGDVIDYKIKNYSNSFNAIKTEFKDDSRALEMLNVKEFGPRLRPPNGMHLRYNRLSNNRQSFNVNQLNINSSTTLLSGAVHPFEEIVTLQDKQFDFSQHNLFYQDQKRAYFIKPEYTKVFNSYNQYISDLKQFRFLPFFHPYTKLFIRELNRKGLDGLMKRNVQVAPQNFPPQNTFDFSVYNPSTTNAIVDATAQKDIVDFSMGGAYSIYNWELFFHAPLMIACKLMQNQRFEEAMRWFHYIFNPTNIDAVPTPQRYWVTKPFFEYNDDNYRKQRIENLLKNIDNDENNKQLIAWRNNPFKPHLIARYRPVAYQKTVVMKYIDNLIGWGDMLFRRDTMEAINEASLLYMLAYELLGDRPIKVPNVAHEDKSFNDIEAKLDDFGNASVDVLLEDTLLPIQIVPSNEDAEPMPKMESFYFCIPNNDIILKYWDTVEDRLFKIRRCMNIEGVVRQLPLFEPPIDPALLVKAAAAGIDINSVLNDVSAATPNYRFRVVIQKALEFCNEVKMLGDKLLSVLEKKDAEGLILLRSEQEIQLLKQVKEVRKKQIDEIVETIGSLNKSFEMATQKEDYYNEIPRMNTWEDFGAIAHGLGIVSEIVSTVLNATSGGTHLIPQLKMGAAGFGGTPTFTAEFGGKQVADSAGKFAALFQGLSTILHSGGSMLETQASYTRRDDENKQQAKLAKIEKDQLQFQINAAEIRQAIAEKELDNQELQIENSKVVDEYMKNKYTNVQLYSWMISKISAIYFQAYQLALDMGKKAERCYCYELGIENTNFIQPNYWDSLKKGLLSGEALMNDLHRLDAAYIDNSKRGLEIRKHISLSLMFPLQLIQLKETGKCTLKLPEWLFNMDYPGHYFRRIKSISVSIPCIVGPYTSINCTLSLIKSTIRIDPTGAQYNGDENDPRFRTQMGAITSIATSTAQNDAGLFEINFNDDRYLPFEGLGTESEWEIVLPKENNYFEFASISDFIIHINYTARSGGEVLAQKAMQDLDDKLPKNTARLFSLKHEFPNEWYRFMHPGEGVLTPPEIVINIKPEHYPFFVRGKLGTIKIKTTDVWVESSDATGNIDAVIQLSGTSKSITINEDLVLKVYHGSADIGNVNPVGEVKIIITSPDVINKIQNIYLLLQSPN